MIEDVWNIFRAPSSTGKNAFQMTNSLQNNSQGKIQISEK